MVDMNLFNKEPQIILFDMGKVKELVRLERSLNGSETDERFYYKCSLEEDLSKVFSKCGDGFDYVEELYDNYDIDSVISVCALNFEAALDYLLSSAINIDFIKGYRAGIDRMDYKEKLSKLFDDFFLSREGCRLSKNGLYLYLPEFK